MLLCKKCDVFVGYDAAGVATIPAEHNLDPVWCRDHCWVCGRSRAEVEADPYDLHRSEPTVRVTATGPDGEPLGAWETTESGEHKRLDDLISETGVDEPPVKPSTAITRYVDRAMFEAERFEEAERERPRVHLLSATPDPLGAVAAFSMMYEGQTVTDLAEVTDDERRHYWAEAFKTALKSPLEAIDLHFVVTGLTRASWDQLRTQRTAVFAGESLRFAVKEHLAEAVRPGPMVSNDRTRTKIWDDAIDKLGDAYMALIGAGAPAEDARGLLPMNTLTRGHWKTNLRNLESEIGKRLCTQAQFEWRLIHADLRRAVGEYRGVATGPATAFHAEYGNAWQWKLIANEPNLFRPICFQKGACMFKASMDRGCTIRSRVDAGQFDQIAVEEWAADPTAAWVR
jgi:thymidylate synthase ThyX